MSSQSQGIVTGKLVLVTGRSGHSLYEFQQKHALNWHIFVICTKLLHEKQYENDETLCPFTVLH